MTTVADIPFQTYTHNGKTINIVWVDDLLERLNPNLHKYYPYPNSEITWQQRCEIIEGWVKENNACYYNSDNGQVNLDLLFERALEVNTEYFVVE